MDNYGGGLPNMGAWGDMSYHPNINPHQAQLQDVMSMMLQGVGQPVPSLQNPGPPSMQQWMGAAGRPGAQVPGLQNPQMPGPARQQQGPTGPGPRPPQQQQSHPMMMPPAPPMQGGNPMMMPPPAVSPAAQMIMDSQGTPSIPTPSQHEWASQNPPPPRPDIAQIVAQIAQSAVPRPAPAYYPSQPSSAQPAPRAPQQGAPAASSYRGPNARMIDGTPSAAPGTVELPPNKPAASAKPAANKPASVAPGKPATQKKPAASPVTVQKAPPTDWVSTGQQYNAGMAPIPNAPPTDWVSTGQQYNAGMAPIPNAPPTDWNSVGVKKPAEPAYFGGSPTGQAGVGDRSIGGYTDAELQQLESQPPDPVLGGLATLPLPGAIGAVSRMAVNRGASSRGGLRAKPGAPSRTINVSKPASSAKPPSNLKSRFDAADAAANAAARTNTRGGLKVRPGAKPAQKVQVPLRPPRPASQMKSRFDKADANSGSWWSQQIGSLRRDLEDVLPAP